MSEEQPKVAEQPKVPEITHLQHVIITFADGRKGIFAGPMVVGMAELRLKPPTISEVVICEPRPINPPQEEPKPDELKK